MVTCVILGYCAMCIVSRRFGVLFQRPHKPLSNNINVILQPGNTKIQNTFLKVIEQQITFYYHDMPL